MHARRAARGYKAVSERQSKAAARVSTHSHGPSMRAGERTVGRRAGGQEGLGEGLGAETPLPVFAAP